MKVLLITALLSSPFLSIAETQKPTMSRVEQLLDLTNREIRTIRDNNYTGPDLKHRLFELYTEKIKLLREKETQSMMKDDPETVIKRGKESYFAQSLEQYELTQKFGLGILEQFPNFQKVAEVYYTLAINSRDFGTNTETEPFLKLAIKYSKENSKTLFNSKVSLAEYYYNEKKYADAVKFYDEILKNKTDEWYGKHLYNAAWCHLKERNFSKALNLIKESYETTKENKYVSMREQILNAIGIFYVQADQTKDAITFFERNTKPASHYLLMLANSSMNKNNFSTTEDVLRAALRDTINRKSPNDELKVRLGQLEIYRESKKDDLFFNTSQNIVDLYKTSVKLPADDMNTAINKIKDVAGFMQVNLVKDKTKEVVHYSKDDYRKIIKYFDMLSILDKKNLHQYRYYQGETALSIRDFHTSMKYYVRSIKYAKKIKDNGEYTKKSLEAILSVLDETDLPKKLKDEYVIFTYKNYLVIYPQSDKSQTLYQKLFNKYFELKKTKKATNTMLVYKDKYPADDKIHREMLTQILDHYIKLKNTDMIAAWIRIIEKGYLNFSNDYIQNSIAVLGDLLFDRYHNLEKKGKLKEAMVGYEEIYDSKLYPNRIKAEAAYAMAAALLDLNNANKSYKWLQKSLEIYDPKDLAKVTASLFVMDKNYRLLQHFDMTVELSRNISKKFCSDKIDQKDGFYELLFTTEALNNLSAKNLLAIETEFLSCGISEKSIKAMRSEALSMMIENDQYNEAKNYFHMTEHSEGSKKIMANYLKFKFFQNPEMNLHDMEEISRLNPEMRLLEMITHYQEIKNFKDKLANFKIELSVSEKFEAERYNSELEQYLSMLNDFQKEAVLLSKESSPEEIIMMREVLSKPIFALKNAISNYEPKGVDNKYLQGFKMGMRQVSESLAAKALQFDREKVSFLEKNNYFFEIQKHATFDTAETKLLNNHSAILFANTLDRGMNDAKAMLSKAD